MDVYAALDVSLDETAICVVDRDGAIVLEAKVASEAAAIAAQLQPYAASSAGSVWKLDRSRNGSSAALPNTNSLPC
jgi:hypothetical protein